MGRSGEWEETCLSLSSVLGASPSEKKGLEAPPHTQKRKFYS